MGGCRSSLGCCQEGVTDLHAPTIDPVSAFAVEGSASNFTSKVQGALDQQGSPRLQGTSKEPRISKHKLLSLDAEVMEVPPKEPPLLELGNSVYEGTVEMHLPVLIDPNLDVKGQLHGELVEGVIWAPGGVYQSDCSFKYNVINALDLCGAASYRVTHYNKQAQGRAFGPLSLEQVLSFCNRLDERLQQGQRVVLITQPNDESSHTNAAVLLGTFLIHVLGWTVREVTEAMNADADRKFVCSWARRDRLEPVRTMRVCDCWAAMEEARKRDWFTHKSFREHSSELLEICKMRTSYDAAWIVPGKILLCADPVSTAFDPNPATFESIFPSDVSIESAVLPAYDDRDEVESVTSCDSTHTVNKDYSSDVSTNEAMDDNEHMTFVDFLHRCRVRLLVRANYPIEPGLPGSYDSKRLVGFGIKHLDVPIADRNGGLPSADQIHKVCRACNAIIKEGSDAAIAIHCKGGFGRSAVLAACVASSCFQIPGPALLAWLRIARPGAVTTLEQERFIQNLGKEPIDGRKSSCTSFVMATRSLKHNFAHLLPTVRYSR